MYVDDLLVVGIRGHLQDKFILFWLGKLFLEIRIEKIGDHYTLNQANCIEIGFGDLDTKKRSYPRYQTTPRTSSKRTNMPRTAVW